MHTHKRGNDGMFKVSTAWQTSDRHGEHLVTRVPRTDGPERGMIVEVKSQSEAAQSSPPLCDLMGCSPPGSSIHRTFWARILEWVPFPSPGDLPDLLQSYCWLLTKINSLPLLYLSIQTYIFIKHVPQVLTS